MDLRAEPELAELELSVLALDVLGIGKLWWESLTSDLSLYEPRNADEMKR